MVRAGIQLYTLRNVDRPFGEVLERVADAGFDGVEFAYRVTDEDPEEVAETLADTGLAAAGAHVPIDALEDDFEATVGRYETLGCDDVAVPYLDEEFFGSRESVAEAVDRLAAIQANLDERGIDLHYHNHDHEYVDLDDGSGETGFDAFVDASEFGIELDLGLALRGGDDPVARLEALGERAPLVHVKDFDIDADESVPVGEGDLDVEACADVVSENGGEWLIYEYEGEDPLASLDDAAATMRGLCNSSN